jgi:hypothetical protein
MTFRRCARNSSFCLLTEENRRQTNLRLRIGPVRTRAGDINAPIRRCCFSPVEIATNKSGHYPRSLSDAGWAATVGITTLTAPVTFAEGTDTEADADAGAAVDSSRPRSSQPPPDGRAPEATEPSRATSIPTHAARNAAHQSSSIGLRMAVVSSSTRHSVRPGPSTGAQTAAASTTSVAVGAPIMNPYL